MIELLFADAWILVVSKPPGLLAVPGKKSQERDCLVTRVAEAFGEVRVVHRLDRDTSGVMVLARDRDSHRHLSSQFEHRRVGKTYQAVVHGSLEEEAGSIELPLARWLAAPPRHRVDWTWGKPAITHYRVLRRDQHTTRVLLEPLTGRSHQLRVHLAALGHAIVGDPLYAEMVGITRTSSERMLLHAERLTLTHPTTGESTTFCAPCPF